MLCEWGWQEITVAEVRVDTARTEEDARSSTAQSVLACHAVAAGAVLETPAQGCGSGYLLLPVPPRAQEQHGSVEESARSGKAVQT